MRGETEIVNCRIEQREINPHRDSRQTGRQADGEKEKKRTL